MQHADLEKSAENYMGDPVPKEVLNPHQTAKRYVFHTYQPSANLEAFIDYYWIMRWNLAGQPPFMAEVIPSPYTNLTFMPEGARVTGVTTGKYEYELKGRGVIIGVKFKPGGLRAFWKKSMSELTDTFVPATRLFPEADAIYNDAILRVPDKQAIGLLENLLQSKQPILDKHLKLITRILDYVETIDQPSLPAVVAYSRLSERRLQEIFREYVGAGLKWIMLRARLIKAAELAATLENPSWTSIAHDLGYGDQSHFSNDFKRVIGKTPTQYAAAIDKSA